MIIVVQQTVFDIDAAIIFVVIATSIAIGFIGYRANKTVSQFLFANKALGSWLLAFSIMSTYYSAASFLGGGGATYLYNLGFGAWLTAWHVIGVLILWFVVASKLFDYVSKTNALSIPELIEHRYKSFGARVIASSIIILLFTLYLVSVYKSGAIVIAKQFSIDFSIALLILVIPVLIYIVVGGMRAAAINNLFLGTLMLVAAALTFYYIMSYVGGPMEGLKKLSNTTILGKYPGDLWLRIDGMGPPQAMKENAVPQLIMSIAFSIGMAQVALPNLLLQFYAARDKKAISRGRIIGPVLVALYAMLMFSLGAFAHLIIDNKLSKEQVTALMKDVDWVIPTTISMIVEPGLRGIIIAGPIAASMTTIALTVLTIANTVVRDFIQPFKNIEKESTLVLTAKIASIMFSLIPIPLALTQNQLIIDLVSASFGTIFACFIGPVTIGLYWKKASREAAIASMLIGAVTGVTWYMLIYRKYTWIHSTIPATILAILTFTILSITTKQK